MKLRTKLALGFIAVIAAVSGASILALVNDRQARTELRDYLEINLREQAAATRFHLVLKDSIAVVHELMFHAAVGPNNPALAAKGLEAQGILDELEAIVLRWEAAIRDDVAIKGDGSENRRAERDELNKLSAIKTEGAVPDNYLR